MPDPVLFLPGFMADGRLFWHSLLDLSARRSVGVARLRGASIEEMAEHALAEAPGRFVLAGHWLGGVVAMEMLRRAPGRIARLILLDVSPLPERPGEAAAREARIIKARAGRLDEAMLEEIPAGALFDGPARTEAQAMMLDMAATLGAAEFERQSRALMRRPDQQRALHQARLPALLLCGEADTLCPPRRHEFLAEMMPQGRFVAVPGAGHLSPLEAPEAVTAAISGFLAAE